SQDCFASLCVTLWKEEKDILGIHSVLLIGVAVPSGDILTMSATAAACRCFEGKLCKSLLPALGLFGELSSVSPGVRSRRYPMLNLWLLWGFCFMQTEELNI
ncbi:hypothetical protein DQ04_17511010, partial [Trypanosoma grayi]|uniref:hypothetical protein n=1 Tax=Trypanosoma grayi TaxID=71804 RepID=UPI0004F3FEB7